ncbi:MAG: hypothetical protein VB093_18920, partial [Propionicimonas sp.]|nr:hypothetical protein [Propionicimonas sp.]
MARIFSRAAAVAALAAITMGLAACSSGSPAAPGGESTSGSSPDTSATTAATSEAPASSAPDVTELTTTPGTLTIATGNPAYSPWVEDDKPESKQGFEAAVAYAVAEKLGFADADVSWVRTTFDE